MKRFSQSELSRFLTSGARYVLAGVFGLSAVSKIVSPRDFTTLVSSVEFLSWLDPAVALVCVVILEFVLAILLLTRPTSQAGAIAAFVSLFAFSGFLIYANTMNSDQPCGCFGTLSSGMTFETDILRNIALAAGCALIIFQTDRYAGR